MCEKMKTTGELIKMIFNRNVKPRLRAFLCVACGVKVSHLSKDKVNVCPVCRAGKADVPVEELLRQRWWAPHN
jgi:rubrerythrin